MLHPDPQDIEDQRKQFPYDHRHTTPGALNRDALIAKMRRVVVDVQDETTRDILETIISLL